MDARQPTMFHENARDYLFLACHDPWFGGLVRDAKLDNPENRQHFAGEGLRLVSSHLIRHPLKMSGRTWVVAGWIGLALVFVGCDSAQDEGIVSNDGTPDLVDASDASPRPSDAATASRTDAEDVNAERLDADAGSSAGASDAVPPPLPRVPGHVLFKDAATTHYFLLEAKQGAKPVDVSAKLDAISAGEDQYMTASTDGLWYASLTTRFGCEGYACLTLISAQNMETNTVVAPSGRYVREAGVVAAGGKTVVYVAKGTHEEDLFVTHRSANGWTEAVNLTSELRSTHNALPRFSKDGIHVVFSCGATWYQSGSTDVCEVELDGGPARVLVRDADGPTGTTGRLRNPDYAPDGSVVFEGQWATEQIWRFSGSSGKSTPVSSRYTNDNSPCVIPDGRIASLWMGRPENKAGLHELKIMNADGTGVEVIYKDRDVFDSGLSCMP